MAFPGDKRLPKALVYSVYIMETAQTVLVTRDAYLTFASGFGNLDAVNSVHTLWLAIPAFTGVGKPAMRCIIG